MSQGISSHSPILLSYPGAVLLGLDGPGITRVEYFQHLFAPDDEEGSDPRKR